MTSLPNWTRPNNFQVNPHQAVVDKLNELAQFFPADGSDTEVLSTPTGKGIFGPGHTRILWQDWGVVQYNGPGGDPPKTIEQYYVGIAGIIPRIIGVMTADQRIRFVPQQPTAGSGSGSEPKVVVATNIAELPEYTADEVSGSGSGSGGSGSTGVGGSHGIRAGQQVFITAVQIRSPGTSGITGYIFNMTPKAMKVKITAAATMSGSTNRWRYSWTEQRILQSGRWEDKPGGLTSSSTLFTEGVHYAYNEYEANNGANGIQGNSYNLSSFPSTYQMVPVRGSPIVDLFGWTNCNGEHEEHFFYPNAIEGSCP